ncbi:sulfur oxidation protein SoxY [Paenalcaligenes niemegkensis]|uniref:thiosulfate oxidation carrier protein SoxY n=1 Tax=Paenalcaligenes niemegkensis TaxID=2895469 RepID=UPI001EE8C48F|nr:thiosulfate oxidation carrier protein SoxY [Paenalcaligenes niemegkensis]MCQ9616146.1 sulfur oxidation protein SoxY [Paenalcaligenes niemegkensis]
MAWVRLCFLRYCTRSKRCSSYLKARAEAEVKAIVDEFLQGTQPLEQDLKLDMPVLGDNPAAVPVKAIVELPITPDSYCEELIILAEGNPRPLACRFKFTPLTGRAEVAVRLRLIETQTVSALARMNDGRVLMARQHITVTAGGCGM